MSLIHLLRGISLSTRHTLLLCTIASDASLQVKSILSVVAMVPHWHHLPFPGDISERYFILGVASLGGVVENGPVVTRLTKLF